MSLIRQSYDKFRQYFSTHYPKLYSLCEEHKSVVKFIIAGCSAAFVDLGLLYIFHGALSFGLVISTSLAFVLAFLISFSLQKFWTFRNYRQDKVVGQLGLYILNALLGLYLNGLFMHLLVYRFQVWYLLAQVAVNLALGFWNFIIYKFIVFRPDKYENNRQ